MSPSFSTVLSHFRSLDPSQAYIAMITHIPANMSSERNAGRRCEFDAKRYDRFNCNNTANKLLSDCYRLTTPHNVYHPVRVCATIANCLRLWNWCQRQITCWCREYQWQMFCSNMNFLLWEKFCAATLDWNRSYFTVHSEYIVSQWGLVCVANREMGRETDVEDRETKIADRIGDKEGVCVYVCWKRSSHVLLDAICSALPHACEQVIMYVCSSRFNNKLVQEHHDALKFNLCSFHFHYLCCLVSFSSALAFTHELSTLIEFMVHMWAECDACVMCVSVCICDAPLLHDQQRLISAKNFARFCPIFLERAVAVRSHSARPNIYFYSFSSAR